MSVLTLAAGRRSKFVVAGLALLIALALGSQAGKLTGVTSNEQADSLPRGAESVAALAAVKRFPGGATTPAVTVIRRDGGLTAADRAYLDGRRASLNSDRLPYARFTPPAIISRDGTAAVLVTPFATADDVRVSDGTKALRARLAVGRPSGLTVARVGRGLHRSGGHGARAHPAHRRAGPERVVRRHPAARAAGREARGRVAGGPAQQPRDRPDPRAPQCRQARRRSGGHRGGARAPSNTTCARRPDTTSSSSSPSP